MSELIAVIDYGSGNLRSVEKAMQRAVADGGIDARVNVVSDGDAVRAASRIVLPGVGAFEDAANKLRATGLDAVVIEQARAGKPLLGICLGMQMACIEAARNTAGIPKANSTEFGPTKEPIVGLMTEWTKGNEKETRSADGDMGGTMRLGLYKTYALLSLHPDSEPTSVVGHQSNPCSSLLLSLFPARSTPLHTRSWRLVRP